MTLVVEIGMIVAGIFGLFGLMTGQWNLNRRMAARGAAVRAAGFVLLLPFPFTLLVESLLGFFHPHKIQSIDPRDFQVQIFLIEAGCTITCLVLAAAITLLGVRVVEEDRPIPRRRSREEAERPNPERKERALVRRDGRRQKGDSTGLWIGVGAVLVILCGSLLLGGGAFLWRYRQASLTQQPEVQTPPPPPPPPVHVDPWPFFGPLQGKPSPQSRPLPASTQATQPSR